MVSKQRPGTSTGRREPLHGPRPLVGAHHRPLGLQWGSGDLPLLLDPPGRRVSGQITLVLLQRPANCRPLDSSRSSSSRGRSGHSRGRSRCNIGRDCRVL